MKRIHSVSKMREVMELPPFKEGKKRAAIFAKGVITELENSDYDFLKKDHAGFNFYVKNGDFKLLDEEEVAPSGTPEDKAAILKQAGQDKTAIQKAANKEKKQQKGADKKGLQDIIQADADANKKLVDEKAQKDIAGL